ncbi:MAG: glutaminyl-peptide cyclotransferase [Phycisphaerae bacterium]|nr:glutaminyl-peptide cyclotransferase [Gemmatimonadaceae bacterium]
MRCLSPLSGRTVLSTVSLFALLLATTASACTGDKPETNANAMPVPAGNRTPTYTYEVVRAFPHDTGSFTEGLLFHEGKLFESTGEIGTSYIREVDLETGRAIRQRDLTGNDSQNSGYFGEGIVIFGENLIQLTYKSEVAFIYDWKTFAPKGQFKYQGEGWAFTTDTVSLIMSNGSAVIAFRDPATFEAKRTIEVTDHGVPVSSINELEWVKGEIWANVWQTDQIARINPANGHVTGWINLAGIVDAADRHGRMDVLNGIAYNATTDRVFVTGKRWSKMYEIKLKERS